MKIGRITFGNPILNHERIDNLKKENIKMFEIGSKIKATIGRIVVYKLSQSDVDSVMYSRSGTAGRVDGRQEIFKGNQPIVGDEYPMIITRVWGPEPDMVNGQVFLDGNDSLWVTSVKLGDKPREWHWPFII